jgi:hypothetical protein
MNSQTHMGMVAMSARWPAGLERCLGYGGSKSWGQKANRYSNGVYERAMTGMKTELWQYDSTVLAIGGCRDNFLVAAPASETRGGMVARRSRRGGAADLAPVNEVYIETMLHLDSTLFV